MRPSASPLNTARPRLAPPARRSLGANDWQVRSGSAAAGRTCTAGARTARHASLAPGARCPLCLQPEIGPSHSCPLACPLQVFWNVTLPNIRWGLLYGLILTNAVGAPASTCSAAHCYCCFVCSCWRQHRVHPCRMADRRPPAASPTFQSQRAMGEFGAVAVISGNIIGQTQTLTLYVESAYKVG